MLFSDKYRTLNDLQYPVDIIGMGSINLEKLPIEVVDEWFALGKLDGVIALKEIAIEPELDVDEKSLNDN